MAQFNKVFFSGYAGRDAELRTAKEMKIAVFSLCSTEKGKNGKPDIQTWMTIKAFGWQADQAAKVKKGQNILVEGRLQTNSFKNKEGVEKTSLEIIANFIAPLQKVERDSISESVLVEDDLSNIPF